ncbi:helix-turn-helix domain-containing protein [Sphingosinicella rhizophila]|uniref:Helix-turn-helix domain-containing protein n=1 Tax=Sphingosinicella rhizophila TaxID=3050082 RepID=A0ABU3Q556_9SPHN|nr:helix-turn-helix domain-containing protein [Sphingosinicella sp. GR2756]MDT9598548.1 helix-turn-helix domain-containing protein [Sphingosinicella sp. GR2756]
MSTPIERLAEKLRRSVRNNTGTRMSFEELKLIAELGGLELIAQAETEEIMAKWRNPALAPEAQPLESAHNNGRPYSPASLAERWQCSSTLVRNMIQRGELKHFRYGKLYRIPADEVARIEDPGQDAQAHEASDG